MLERICSRVCRNYLHYCFASAFSLSPYIVFHRDIYQRLVRAQYHLKQTMNMLISRSQRARIYENFLASWLQQLYIGMLGQMHFVSCFYNTRDHRIISGSLGSASVRESKSVPTDHMPSKGGVLHLETVHLQCLGFQIVNLQ